MERWTRSPSAWLSTLTPGTSFSASSAPMLFDFVFSIVGEEYGFVGTIFFLSLFLFIMLRGFKIAKNAKDEFSRLLAIAITSTVTLYALVNAAVTLRKNNPTRQHSAPYQARLCRCMSSGEAGQSR